jgi:small subunit ribosomal protein S2
MITRYSEITPHLSQSESSFYSFLFQSGTILGHHPLKRKSFSSRLWFSDSKIVDSFLGNRQEFFIFDPKKIVEFSYRGLYLLATVIRRGGSVLVIETGGDGDLFSLSTSLKRKSRPISQSISGSRWIGGTLTNWDSISQMVSQYASLSLSASDFLKRNRIASPRYQKMKTAYPSFFHQNQSSLFLPFQTKPDLLVVLHPNKNKIVLEEAARLHIPVIGFVDSNTETELINYPIPVNTENLFWIHYWWSLLFKLGKGFEIPPSRLGEGFSQPL